MSKFGARWSLLSCCHDVRTWRPDVAETNVLFKIKLLYRRIFSSLLLRALERGLQENAAGSKRPKTALVALGGNALLERGEEPTAANQTRHARDAAVALARLVKEEEVVLLVTHGNGPQVGLLALQVCASAIPPLFKGQ
jgi:hypothetical protein